MNSPEEIAEYVEQKRLDRKFSEWRTKVIKKIPALSRRIFRLRRKNYMGSGFHYAMEGDLGNVLHKVSNPDTWPIKSVDKFHFRLILEVNYESLVTSVKEAEISAGMRKTT